MATIEASMAAAMLNSMVKVEAALAHASANLTAHHSGWHRVQDAIMQAAFVRRQFTQACATSVSIETREDVQ